jgi:hypothetical protein
VSWLLVIPHVIILYFLQIAFMVLVFVSFFTILFTKQIPQGIFNFQAMVLRYEWRVGSYGMFTRQEYPKFEYETVPGDPQDDAARFTIQQPAEYQRWMPLIKWLLVIPHVIVLAFLAIALFVVWIIGFFAVLFTARWPEGLRDFTVGVNRWALRVGAYAYLLVDEYPPFTLEER